MRSRHCVALVASLLLLPTCSAGEPEVALVQDGVTWNGYETTFLYFAEQPEGTADCGRPYFHGVTSGFLGAKQGPEGGVDLHWEGMGCDISVEGTWPAGPFEATATPCAFSPSPSLSRFAVEGIELDELRFEPASATLNMRGRMLRNRGGQRSTLCFETPDPT
jgi:hypothetical protein